MRIKKIIAILSSVVVLGTGAVGLTGCGSNEESGGNEESGSNEEKSASDTLEKIYEHFVPSESTDNSIYECIMKLGDDNSYLKVYSYMYTLRAYGLRDSEGTFYDEALEVVSYANDKLNIPDSLYEKIMNTSGNDGTCEEEYDNVSVTWSYSAINGLEIMYEAKK